MVLNKTKKLDFIRDPSISITRGGVEDTRLEAKAKDAKKKKSEAKDRPSRGQGPRTQAQVFSKKKSLKIFFRRSQKKKVFKKIFLAKKIFKIFFQVFSS